MTSASGELTRILTRLRRRAEIGGPLRRKDRPSKPVTPPARDAVVTTATPTTSAELTASTTPEARELPDNVIAGTRTALDA